MSLERELARRSVEQSLFGIAWTIGRYTIRGELGVGGMGAVYLGRDPQLDREVAIKMVRAEHSDATRERLLREAKALAKLAHPNVVAVYEVGTHEGTPFIAMEYVAGRTLGEWRAELEPGPAEIVEMFLAVGRGLAAAHEQGIVHRDFKPSNVMVGPDGRPRVLDFGIAKASGARVDPGPAIPSTSSGGQTEPTASGDQTEPDLTGTSVVMGTPLYMAPEQRAGHEADPRSDQYSFCVSLYEALYGVHPFRADSYAELVERAHAGRVGEAPAGAKVGPTLRRVLLRGLDPDPDARYPDMTALLRSLEELHRPARGRAGLVTGAVAVAVAGAVWWAMRADPCAEAAVETQAAWAGTRRDAVRERITAAGPSYAEATWVSVDEQLGDYVAELAQAQVQACQARHDPPSIVDARALCLDRRQHDLATLVDALATVDASGLEHVPAAVASTVTGLSRCLDREALLLSVTPPDDAVAADVAALREELSAVKLQRSLGEYDEAATRARAAVSTARELGYEPVVAEALEESGRAAHAAGDYETAQRDLEEAYFLASRIPHEEVVGRVGSQLVAVATDRGDFEGAEEWSRHTDSDLVRGHASDELRADWYNTRGLLLQDRGEYEQARGLHEQALALVEGQTPVDVLSVATMLSNISVALVSEGRYDEAIERLERALAHVEAELPPGHPEQADIHNNIGALYNRMGRDEDGRRHHALALEIREAALGPDHPRTALSHGNLGDSLVKLGQIDEGLAHIDQAIAITERNDASAVDLVHLRHQKARALNSVGRPEEAIPVFERTMADAVAVYGPDHPTLVAIANNLAYAHELAGHEQEALEHAQAALELGERALGKDHLDVSFLHVGLGTSLYGRGRYEEALAQHRAALAIREASPSCPPSLVGDAYHNVGTTLMKLEQPEAATEALRHAIEIRRALPPEPRNRLKLAASLRALGTHLSHGGEARGAVEALEEARQIYEQTEPVDGSELAVVLTALGEHRLRMGEAHEALVSLERADAIERPLGSDRGQVARTRFALARALVLDHGDRTRALAAAEQARETFRELGAHWQSSLVEVEAWLAAQG